MIACTAGRRRFGFATTPLVCDGLHHDAKCHLNTCSVGIGPRILRYAKQFQGQPEHVINFFFFIAEQVRSTWRSSASGTVDEMVGTRHLLDVEPAVDHWKGRGSGSVGYTLHPPVPSRVARAACQQDPVCSRALDHHFSNKLALHSRPSSRRNRFCPYGSAPFRWERAERGKLPVATALPACLTTPSGCSSPVQQGKVWVRSWRRGSLNARRRPTIT